MNLKFLGSGGSDRNGCPTLYAKGEGYVVEVPKAERTYYGGVSRTRCWIRPFLECRRSAFHMEVRDSYLEPSESEALRRFLNDEPPPEYDKSDWIQLIQDMTDRGVGVSRIRVVTVPHSGYQRWLLSVTGENVEAGEDIRYIPRHTVPPEIVPSDDWWLFDERIVVFNLSDADGRPAGTGTTTDPGIVTYCREVKAKLWPFAIPYRDYYERPVTAR